MLWFHALEQHVEAQSEHDGRDGQIRFYRQGHLRQSGHLLAAGAETELERMATMVFETRFFPPDPSGNVWQYTLFHVLPVSFQTKVFENIESRRHLNTIATPERSFAIHSVHELPEHSLSLSAG